MTIDPGVVAIAVVAITVVSGAAGAIIQRRFAANDRREAEAALEARERRGRIRDHELKRIDHTRRQLEQTRFSVLAVLAGASPQEATEQLERSDMAVVGDPVAARRWALVTMKLAGEAAEHLQRTGRLPIRLPTDEEQNEMVAAREAVMAALDKQERRVLNDEEPILLERGSWNPDAVGDAS